MPKGKGKRKSNYAAKGRRSYKGKHQSGAGSGSQLVALSRAPAIPRFERMLARVGVPVQRFREFRQSERLTVSPTSGKAYWYGVPTQKDFGEPMVLTDYGTLGAGVQAADIGIKHLIKQTPNSCDLYDIYKNLISGVTHPDGTKLHGDTRFDAVLSGHQPAVAFSDYPYGTQSTQKTATGTRLHDQVPGVMRIIKPGMDYEYRTHVTYDNISSLDAFVEVYRLDYLRPRTTMDDHTAYDLGGEYTPTALGTNNALRHMSVHWRYSAIHPGEPFTPCPDNLDSKRKYHHANFGGALLRGYCHAALFQRMSAYTSMAAAPDLMTQTVDLGPAIEGALANSRGKGSVSDAETIQMVCCNPRIDPLKVTPPTRPTSQLGYRLRRVRGARRVKPGDSGTFDLPFLGQQRYNFATSHCGQLDQDVLREFTGDDAESCPVNRASVYLFRVWGDMVHDHVAPSFGETDFQSGSTAVTFHTQRVVWARYRPIFNTVVNPVLLDFDDAIAPERQVHINEETDAPMVVREAGDSSAAAAAAGATGDPYA